MLRDVTLTLVFVAVKVAVDGGIEGVTETVTAEGEDSSTLQRGALGLQAGGCDLSLPVFASLTDFTDGNAVIFLLD